MRFFGFIFVRRQWSTDKQILRKALQNLSQQNTPFWLLIFPEGTVINASTHARCMDYAKVKGISPVPRHVLLPRTTGVQYCLEELSKRVEMIIDVTVGYHGLKPAETAAEDYFSLKRIFGKGLGPSQISMHIRIIPVTETNVSQQVIYDIFNNKDDLMEKFYKTGSFVGKGDVVEKVPVGKNGWLAGGYRLEYALVKIWIIHAILICLVVYLQSCYISDPWFP